jgi:hypothetical protein
MRFTFLLATRRTVYGSNILPARGRWCIFLDSYILPFGDTGIDYDLIETP